jgi:hypothetical protein
MSHKGKKLSEEHKRKIKEGARPYIRTAEHRRIVSERNRGEKNYFFKKGDRQLGEKNHMYNTNILTIWIKKYGKEEANKKWKEYRLKFKKLIFCLIIAFILAFPFWVLFPIVSPSSIYFSNNVVNQREIPKEINLSQTFNYYNNTYNQSVVGTKENYLAVSSFPSMHVTWGIIAIWFLMEKKKYLNMLFLSWLIIEIIATIYTMQHYAIDTMFGILFAFLIIKLVDKIFKK